MLSDPHPFLAHLSLMEEKQPPQMDTHHSLQELMAPPSTNHIHRGQSSANLRKSPSSPRVQSEELASFIQCHPQMPSQVALCLRVFHEELSKCVLFGVGGAVVVLGLRCRTGFP